MKKIFLKFLKYLKQIFFPKRCIFCEQEKENICFACLLKIKTFSKTKINSDWIDFSLSYKNPNLKKIFYELKYFYNQNIASDIIKICWEDFYDFLEKIQKIKRNEFLKKEDFLKRIILIPIPISKERLLERSYNQSEILLQEILKTISLKTNLDLKKNYFSEILLKNKNTTKFSKTQTKEEREKLIENIFFINPKYLAEEFLNNFWKDKIIIIFDDITTTHTTFFEARKTFLENNFLKDKILKENIFAFAIAH